MHGPRKCFDRLPREILVPIAIIAGFPISIIRTYAVFLDQITIYHDYALGICKPRNKPVSIPQGGPFLVRFLALPIAPWTVLMRVQGAIPRALADDLTTTTVGDNVMVSTVATLASTFEYLTPCEAR